MIRTAMFRRVELAALDRWRELGELETSAAHLVDPPLEVVMTAHAWDEALADYWDEHDDIGTGGQARGPRMFEIDKGKDHWRITQILDDPAGNHDWRIIADVDLPASDAAGSAVVRATSFERLD